MRRATAGARMWCARAVLAALVVCAHAAVLLWLTPQQAAPERKAAAAAGAPGARVAWLQLHLAAPPTSRPGSQQTSQMAPARAPAPVLATPGTAAPSHARPLAALATLRAAPAPTPADLSEVGEVSEVAESAVLPLPAERIAGVALGGLPSSLEAWVAAGAGANTAKRGFGRAPGAATGSNAGAAKPATVNAAELPPDSRLLPEAPAATESLQQQQFLREQLLSALVRQLALAEAPPLAARGACRLAEAAPLECDHTEVQQSLAAMAASLHEVLRQLAALHSGSQLAGVVASGSAPGRSSSGSAVTPLTLAYAEGHYLPPRP